MESKMHQRRFHSSVFVSMTCFRRPGTGTFSAKMPWPVHCVGIQLPGHAIAAQARCLDSCLEQGDAVEGTRL